MTHPDTTYEFTETDEKQITEILNKLGLEARIKRTDSKIELSLTEKAEWREAYDEEAFSQTWRPALRARHVGELVEVLELNGYRFRVRPTFETPTTITIDGFDTVHEQEYAGETYIPEHYESRYVAHMTEFTAASDLAAGDRIHDPETDQAVLVLEVSEVKHSAIIVSIGAPDTEEFLGHRTFDSRDRIEVLN